MINATAQAAVGAARFGSRWRAPLPASYSFANLPATFERLLVGQSAQTTLPADCLAALPDRVDKVICLFIDSFGWRFFLKYVDEYPFLRRFVDAGVVSPITAQFPSTTTAHITTMYTGDPVGEHGVWEWFYYEPRVDRVIAPLLFAHATDADPNTLAQVGVQPADLFPTATIAHRFAERGVASYVFQPAAYAHSPYSQVANAGATVVGFRSLRDGLTALVEHVNAAPGPAYFMLYYDRFDALCHTHGPDAPMVDAEVDGMLRGLERWLYQPLAKSSTAGSIALCQIADHGHVEVEPRRTVYLNEIWPGLADAIRRDRRGELLLPGGGSCRDLFLYVEPSAIDPTVSELRRRLDGVAEVYATTELVQAGCFGPTCSPTFLARLGEVAVLPYLGESAFWRQPGVFEVKHHGYHGGMTPAEMDVVFAALAM